MAQQPPDRKTGLAVGDEQRGSRGPCHHSSQTPRTCIFAGSASSSSQQQRQQEEEEAPDLAAAAPCSAPATGPASGPGPGRSFFGAFQEQQRECDGLLASHSPRGACSPQKGEKRSLHQQQQGEEQEEETPDSCLRHARCELPPTKRSAPPNIAVGRKSDGGNGAGGIGDPAGDSSRCFNALEAMTPGWPRAAAVVQDDDSSSGDMPRPALNRPVAARDTAAVVQDHGEGGNVPPGRNLEDTPWCCGGGARATGKGGEPGLLCDTLRCKRWMCHACRVEKTRGNGCSAFVCCGCKVLHGPCWCHG